MTTLVCGNSHMIGFKEATETIREENFTFVPIPLCKNFEEAIKSDSGVFTLEAGWENMDSSIGSKSTDIVYNFSQSNKKLIIVGMFLFGCYPVFLPLLTGGSDDPFLICPNNKSSPIPNKDKYQLVSMSCLKQVLIHDISLKMLNYAWLFEKFDKIYWIPSPPPNYRFTEEKFLDDHKWYIKSGLHLNYISIFNECLNIVNKADTTRSMNLTFLSHPIKHLDLNTGLLSEESSFSSSTPDIHASKKYYEYYLKYI